MRARVVLAGLLVAALPALAEAPDSSARPVSRTDTGHATPIAATVDATLPDPATPDGLAGLRPVQRPAALERTLNERLAYELRAAGIPGFVPEDAAVAIARSQAFAARSPLALAQVLRPEVRPAAMVERVMAKRRERARGAVCGDISLQGEAVGYVPGAVSGCGVQDAVKLRSVSGVTLSQTAVMDCGTAKALKRWVEKGLKPSVGSYGGGVAALRVAAHYACRSRNNQRGEKISEHGKGRAIDIAAIRLRNGDELSVLGDWGGGAEGRILRQAHKSACGPFGTVLGPNANAFHRDHFHFDTARYRSGSYCR
ncbi:extensin family protein [Salipiger sp.]|uniref:extensin-like domain-containing protein n=1 Tax=Salipiger sp. TaxID=2078585 RepID=UPI003A97E314